MLKIYFYIKPLLLLETELRIYDIAPERIQADQLWWVFKKKSCEENAFISFPKQQRTWFHVCCVSKITANVSANHVDNDSGEWERGKSLNLRHSKNHPADKSHNFTNWILSSSSLFAQINLFFAICDTPQPSQQCYWQIPKSEIVSIDAYTIRVKAKRKSFTSVVWSHFVKLSGRLRSQ